MVQAARRKFHYIYKTTCLVTNRYYIGMHSTDNLDDGYIGSGQRLWHSINKHGRDNHQCEILEFLDSRAALKIREREIVNEEMLKDSQCMNLKVGGDGGWICHGFYSDEHRQKCSSLGGKVGGPKVAKIYAKKNLETSKKNFLEKNGFSGVFQGKTHSEESKRKIGLANSKYTGESNSQFGTCWIHNDVESKKIKKDELEKFLSFGWKKGRKMKFGE